MKEIKIIQQKSVSIISKAKSIIIKSKEQCVAANEFRRQIKLMAQEVKNTFDPIVSKAYNTYVEARNQRKRYLDPLMTADKDIQIKLGSYAQQEKQKAWEEQRRLQEQAEKRAERERQKLQERLDKAKKIKDKGKIETLKERIENTAPQIIDVKPNIPDKQQRLFFHDDFDFRVEDEKQIPREFMIPDDKAIRAFIKSTKGKREIPGVRIITKQVASTRIR